MKISPKAEVIRTDLMDPADRLITYPRLSRVVKDLHHFQWMHPPRELEPGEVVRRDTAFAFRRGVGGLIHLAVFDASIRTSPFGATKKWGEASTWQIMYENRSTGGTDTHVLPRWYWRMACGSGNKGIPAHDHVRRLGNAVSKDEWDRSEHVCKKCLTVYNTGLEVGQAKYWLAPYAWSPEERGFCEPCGNTGVIMSNPMLNTFHDNTYNCPDCLGRRTKGLILNYNSLDPKIHLRDYDPYRGEYVRVCNRTLGRRGSPTMAAWRRSRPAPRDAAITCYRCYRNPHGGNSHSATCPTCAKPYVIRGDSMTTTKVIPMVWNSQCDCAPHPNDVLKPRRDRLFGGNISTAIREALNTEVGCIDVPVL